MHYFGLPLQHKIEAFTVALSFAKFMCWALLARQSQQGSSKMALYLSNPNPGRQRACINQCIQFFSGHTPVTLSRLITAHFFNTSVTTCLKRTSITGLSHPLATMFTRLFISCTATSKSGKYPTSFSLIKNMVHHVILTGGSGIAVPCFQCRVLCSPKTKAQH